VLTGESFFISDFRNTNSAGVAQVAFSGNYPCKALPLRLDRHGGELVRCFHFVIESMNACCSQICQKGAFLCGAPGTQIDMFFTQKLTTGFFGGEGFILQRYSVPPLFGNS
jgi:uncharacterized protein (AIM24 family)